MNLHPRHYCNQGLGFRPHRVQILRGPKLQSCYSFSCSSHFLPLTFFLPFSPLCRAAFLPAFLAAIPPCYPLLLISLLSLAAILASFFAVIPPCYPSLLSSLMLLLLLFFLLSLSAIPPCFFAAIPCCYPCFFFCCYPSLLSLAAFLAAILASFFVASFFTAALVIDFCSYLPSLPSLLSWLWSLLLWPQHGAKKGSVIFFGYKNCVPFL